jgi:hypothetical protein
LNKNNDKIKNINNEKKNTEKEEKRMKNSYLNGMLYFGS